MVYTIASHTSCTLTHTVEVHTTVVGNTSIFHVGVIKTIATPISTNTEGLRQNAVNACRIHCTQTQMSAC